MSNTTLNITDSLNYQWKDEGMVIRSEAGKNNWNAIDPNIIIDENDTPWMDFGSFWGGMQLVKLDTAMHVTNPIDIRTIASRRSSNPSIKAGSNAIEAPFIFRHAGYYYLFVSFDYCCRGAKSDYKVAVGRSKSVTGPYLDQSLNTMLMLRLE